MNAAQFKTYYLNSSRVGTAADVDYFFTGWNKAYGCCFTDAKPWASTDPKYKVPAICTKVKTAMMSNGCSNTDATRVINAFKKWYKDMYT